MAERNDLVIRLTLRLKATEAAASCKHIVGEVREEATVDGVTVIMIAYQAGTSPTQQIGTAQQAAPRNECERDILAALARLGAQSGSRFTRPAIEAELQRARALHGASTIGYALSRLVRIGLLVNNHDHRGYGFPPCQSSPQTT